MPAIASRLRTFGAESRSSVDNTGPSSCNLVRAAIGRTAGVVATVNENPGSECARFRSLMGAPPSCGLEQLLRPRRPQRSGGCVGSPIALLVSKPGALSLWRACAQRIISRDCIRKSHERRTAVIPVCIQRATSRSREVPNWLGAAGASVNRADTLARGPCPPYSS
jgi:hypothetical protein